MRSFMIAAASLFVCSSAFAQNAANSPSQQNSQTALPQAQTASPQNQTASPQDQGQSTAAEIAEQIKSNLEQAGFKNIKLVPSAFIVRAEDQNDNPVVMVVNSGSITAVSEAKDRLPQSNDHNTVGQGAGGGASSNSDNSNAPAQPRR